MKIKDYILALLITVSILINLVPRRQENGCKCESILCEVKTAILTLTDMVDIIIKNDNKTLLEKYEQEVRENVVLRQEVADQGHQLDLYEGE